MDLLIGCILIQTVCIHGVIDACLAQMKVAEAQMNIAEAVNIAIMHCASAAPCLVHKVCIGDITGSMVQVGAWHEPT